MTPWLLRVIICVELLVILLELINLKRGTFWVSFRKTITWLEIAVVGYLAGRTIALGFEYFFPWLNGILSLMIACAFYAVVAVIIHLRKKRIMAVWNSYPSEAEHLLTRSIATVDKRACLVAKEINSQNVPRNR